MLITARGPKGLGNSGLRLSWYDATMDVIHATEMFTEKTDSDPYESWYIIDAAPPTGAVSFAPVAVATGRVWPGATLADYLPTVVNLDGVAKTSDVAGILNTPVGGSTVLSLIGRLADPPGIDSPVIAVSTPSRPGMCVVYADCMDFGLSPKAGISLSAALKQTPAIVGSGIFLDPNGKRDTTTTSTGRAMLELPQGAIYSVTWGPVRHPIAVDTTGRESINLSIFK